MGINDEYSRDAYNYELAYDSDESEHDNEPLHPEDWQDWYSEELLEAWNVIREYIDSNYIQHKATYSKFVDFVMHPEKFPSHSVPTTTENYLWNLVSNVRIVQERVNAENFYGWVRENIDHHCNV
jgi:hypothetical protein